LSIDEKGHVYSLSDHTVKIPGLDFNAGTQENTNIVTGISYSYDTANHKGIFTETKNNVGNLTLINYSGTKIAASDSINGAFKKIDDYLVDNDNNFNGLLAANYTRTAGKVINAITYNNKVISISEESLTANDIPDLTLSKITDAGTMAAENKDDYLLKADFNLAYQAIIAATSNSYYPALTVDKIFDEDEVNAYVNKVNSLNTLNSAVHSATFSETASSNYEEATIQLSNLPAEILIADTSNYDFVLLENLPAGAN